MVHPWCFYWERGWVDWSYWDEPLRLLLQVRLVISEKGLVCEERDVSLPLQEHKEPWFMRLNLGEEVPVFLHGDTIISDYNQIIDYLERTFVGGNPIILRLQ